MFTLSLPFFPIFVALRVQERGKGNENFFESKYISPFLSISFNKLCRSKKCSIRNNYNFNCTWSYFFSNFQKCNFSETLSFGGKSDLLNHYLPFHPSFHLLETLQIIFLSSFTRDKFFELIQILILFMYPRIGWDSKEMKGKRD